jgi:nicotinamidase-related amidase
MSDDYVPLCTDVQHMYVDGLMLARRKAFPEKIAAFAKRLREKSIPTIWIGLGYGQETKIHGQGSKDLNNVLANLGICGLHKAPDLPPGDKVFIKDNDNAFAHPVGTSALAEHLKASGKHRLIISGMHTTVCVAKTVVGALVGISATTMNSRLLLSRTCSPIVIRTKN